jgi:hypothetical protein
MMKRTKVTVAAGVAALALASAGTGVAFAQTSDPTPSPTPTPSGSPAPHGAHHGHGGFGGGGLLSRIEHGEATVDTGTNNATQVIDIQRGTVDSAGSGTLTVHSADGFSATYTVDSSTKIRKDRKTSDISQVAANDQVTVVAIKAGDTLTAQRINDTGPAR